MPKNLNKIMDAIHGAIAKYDESSQQFRFCWDSEHISRLFDRTALDNALDLISPCDRPVVEQALMDAMAQGRELNTYLRATDKNGNYKWCQVDSWQGEDGYYVLFSGMSPEAQLMQSIAGETVDDIYVIDKANHNLLYANDLKTRENRSHRSVGKKCYQILCGRAEPCDFCVLEGQKPEVILKDRTVEENGRFYATKFRETDWNGRPAYVKYVHDITDEVVSRRERERLEQYFQTVVKNLPGGMAVVHHDLDGSMKPEYLSEGFGEMLGMTHQEAWQMYQDSADTGVHPDDRELLWQHLDRCIREKRDKMEMQYRLQKKNGDYLWVNVKFSLVPCEDGTLRVYADYHDITAERLMQEKLRQQYRDLIQQHYKYAGPDAIILGHCNITQNRIYEVVDHTNSQLLETFGDVREEFFTGIGTLIVDPQERQAFYDKFLNGPTEQAFHSGIEELLMPCFLKLPSQPVGRYVQFKVVLLETPGTGDITGVLTVTDITKSTVREKIFRQLTTTHYDLVADVDLLKDTYEIVSGGDEAIPQSSGKNSERVRLLVENMLIGDQQERDFVMQMLDPAYMLNRLKQEKSYAFPYSIHNLAGEIRTKNMIVSAIDIRLGRVCLIRRDVTAVVTAERKAKEQLEQALEEAKKANRAKSDFLSSMSHDIRTPMNAIIGMTTLALANQTNREKMVDYLHKISLSSQHLLSLINDVLDMSQLEQSKIHLNNQPIFMEELVDHLTSIMTPPAENAGLQFRVDCRLSTRRKVLGDALRIKQILINLLSNAFKFTQKGGTVIFSIDQIPALQPEHIRYCFTVRDTGIGMSPEFLKRLFEPFIRSEQVNQVEGTGLGLSITKGLVDLMGGQIRVSSQLGQGTEFAVELEFQQMDQGVSQEPCQDPTAQQEQSLEGYHFLLVEDNEINSEILGELLQMRGATFTVKSDGLQAVEAFTQSAPGTYDAIFMDIQMPVMNGYEATRRIRASQHPDAKQIVILAMTANAFAEDVQASVEAGMDGHIAKPVDMTLLYNTVTKLVKKKP